MALMISGQIIYEKLIYVNQADFFFFNTESHSGS
jgi:hypothetical protein